IYLSLAVFGLAVIAKTFALVFVVIKWFSILFLCYLAWQFWTASHQDLTMNTPEKRRLFPALISGLTLTLGNPKTIAFYLALLPLVIDLEKVAFATWLYVLAPLTVLVLLAVGGVYIVGAISVRRFLSSHKAQKTMHRTAAIAMAGAAGTMAARGL
ncbi:MAG: LysE family translocator, partial [Gammaproteobacteria bacterium]|nr:LysE family translocator [Gammaproteobacteria bacterium]